ncbi:MAG: DUF1819 family protein [Pseudanabaena sp.]
MSSINNQIFLENKSENEYITYTRCLFAFIETVKIANLLDRGETLENIHDLVLQKDLLQIRSLASRKSSLRIILKRLNLLSEPYIQFIASDNIDVQRLTIFWTILREHRLHRELIREVIIEKLYRLERVISDRDLQDFFLTKYEQQEAIKSWSESTYQKTASHIVTTLVRAGLLYPIQYRKQYEIRPAPLPRELRDQLIADGWEHYLLLMLDFHQVTARALNTASMGSV